MADHDGAILKTGSAAAAVQIVPLVAVALVAAGIALLTAAIAGRRTASAARAM